MAMSTFFVLAAPIAEAIDAVRKAFRKKPPVK